MDIKKILTYTPALQIDASAKEVKERFHERQATHLPVVNDQEFMGCISLEDNHSIEANNTLADHQYLLNRMFITENSNWMDILHEFSRHKSNILPVLDSEGKYTGIIELDNFVQSLSKLAFLKEPGAILVIQTTNHHYSASQISQIVESNNGKITGMFITSFDGNLIECTLKLNSNNINEIVQTFRRYGYEIKSEHIEDIYMEGLKERSKYLQKYLNI